MSELRWNPLLERWIMTVGKRQNRPLMPKDYCPFCPGSGKVPDSYEVLIYENDFPALQPVPEAPDMPADDLYQVRPTQGQCEVILYSPEHQASFADMTLPHLQLLFNLWRERYTELGAREYVKYVYIFENKGDVIGVTMPHPHGQLYAFPFIPPRIAKEIGSAEKYWKAHQRCIFCSILEKELTSRQRVVLESKHFVAFLPFFADYPYEVHVYPRRHIGSLAEMNTEEAEDFMRTLRGMVRTYNQLYGFELPFMMVQHAQPTDGQEYPSYHFHVEFYALHRSPVTIKYNASCETGAEAHCNPSVPEERAEELRQAWLKAQARWPEQP